MRAVFDRAQIVKQRARAAKSPASDFFLFNWAIDQIADRLSFIKKDFPIALRIGARGKDLDLTPQSNLSFFTLDTSVAALGAKRNTVCAEEDFLPFAEHSVDLVISALNLHTVNDLPGALLQIRQALKPDGLFVAAMLGGETLHELRQCLQDAELEISGGITPRIAPFADKQQMGGLLQRAGFALPVVDSDIITVTYDSLFPLMQDLRAMGEGNAIAERDKSIPPRRLFFRTAELYAQRYAENDGRIAAKFEIIFLSGWAPHSSQQKPLKPGSAKNRLADVLGTFEIGAGEKPQ